MHDGRTMIDPGCMRSLCELQQRIEAGDLPLTVITRAGGGIDPDADGFHRHSRPTLLICLDGRLRIAAREEHDIAAGEAVLIHPGAWHRHQPPQAGGPCYVQLGALGSDGDVLCVRGERHWWGRVADPACAGRLLRLALLTRAGGADGVARTLARALFRRVLRRRIDHIVWDETAFRMLGFLWSNLHRPIAARDVALASGAGRTWAFKVFKASFGCTPMALLRGEREALARSLAALGGD